MRVLLVGASGQLGQACLKSVPAHVELRACTHADLDITDPNKITAVVSEFRPDVLINTAAYTAVDKAESDEATARACNAEGPGHLAAAIASQTGARMIHVSTCLRYRGK